MKKKNIKKVTGFTLIELLAVIVILAIIALISTPIIIGVIEKARKGAFEDSAYGVLDAGRVYFVDKLADSNKFEGASFTFPEGGDLKISGEKPADGTMSLDSTGKQAIALFDKDKKWCALKSYEEEKITIKDYKEEECKINGSSGGTASNTIVNKNVEGNSDGLFTDDFGNTRYRGNNGSVKNYVTFNNEVWRIIGVFDGKVKIIRNEALLNPNDGSVPYNSSNPNTFLWNTADTNDWTTSDLQVYLNNGYYNSLQDASKNIVEEVKYNLGGIIDTQTNKNTIYTFERGTTVYTGRSTEWIGKIGLMYLSDYGYAAGKECNANLYQYANTPCRNNNWLYRSEYFQWCLTPLSTSSFMVGDILQDGQASGQRVNNFLTVRPVLYLKQNVKFTSGDGTSSNPYILNLG